MNVSWAGLIVALLVLLALCAGLSALGAGTVRANSSEALDFLMVLAGIGVVAVLSIAMAKTIEAIGRRRPSLARPLGRKVASPPPAPAVALGSPWRWLVLAVPGVLYTYWCLRAAITGIPLHLSLGSGTNEHLTVSPGAIPGGREVAAGSMEWWMALFLGLIWIAAPIVFLLAVRRAKRDRGGRPPSDQA